MPRTIISLDPDDHEWLVRKAKKERVPMTELVRRAVRQFRRQSGPPASQFERLLGETSGLWTLDDGVAFQRRLRAEWDRRK